MNVLIQKIYKKWRQLSSIGAIWLWWQERTNFYKFYGRFEEIDLPYIVSVFPCFMNLVLMSCWGLV
jgi:hypothetical protein